MTGYLNLFSNSARCTGYTDDYPGHRCSPVSEYVTFAPRSNWVHYRALHSSSSRCVALLAKCRLQLPRRCDKIQCSDCAWNHCQGSCRTCPEKSTQNTALMPIGALSVITAPESWTPMSIKSVMLALGHWIWWVTTTCEKKTSLWPLQIKILPINTGVKIVPQGVCMIIIILRQYWVN